MTRRSTPRYRSGSPISASQQNATNAEVGRLTGLQTSGAVPGGRTIYDAAFGRQELPPRLVVVEGVLTESLGAPTDGKTDPTQADMQPWIPDGSSSADPIDFMDEDDNTITLTNRDSALSAASGTFVIAMLIHGEWRPIYIGCDPP